MTLAPMTRGMWELKHRGCKMLSDTCQAVPGNALSRVEESRIDDEDNVHARRAPCSPVFGTRPHSEGHELFSVGRSTLYRAVQRAGDPNIARLKS